MLNQKLLKIMGENKHIKELDAFAKKYVKEIPNEQPSVDFTANLMQKITIESPIKAFKTTSLITKKGWFAIAVLVLVTLGIPFFKSGESTLQRFNINFSFFENLQATQFLDTVSISNTTIYAFIFFGLMIAIQFTYLKQYFDKRFQN